MMMKISVLNFNESHDESRNILLFNYLSSQDVNTNIISMGLVLGLKIWVLRSGILWWFITMSKPISYDLFLALTTTKSIGWCVHGFDDFVVISWKISKKIWRNFAVTWTSLLCHANLKSDWARWVHMHKSCSHIWATCILERGLECGMVRLGMYQALSCIALEGHVLAWEGRPVIHHRLGKLSPHQLASDASLCCSLHNC